MSSLGQRRLTEWSVRERLLTAADELFYAQGIASTGVDAVIKRAGVATGSLYKNFGGKDELIVAYLHARDMRWRSHWETCISEQSEPVERVLAIFTAVARWESAVDDSRGCAHLAATVQLPPGHPGLSAASAHKHHLRARLRELCSATTSSDPTHVAEDVFLLYEGVQNMLALRQGSDPIARARRLAQRSLIGD